MGKRVYRVKKGDDFIKISRKLYGDPSYVMDLMRANPGFYRLGKGMVLRLPKEDPRVTRQRKMKRKMKEYVPSPEEPEEQIDWWDDPGFEDKMANVFAETALSMGMDANLLREELGLGEGSPLLRDETSTGWTESRTEKGNLHSPRTSSGQDTQPTTGDIEQSTAETNSITPESTEKQIEELKKTLREMGLDADVAMEELGVGQIDTAQTTSTDTGEATTGELQSEQALENLYNLGALREKSKKRRVEEQQDKSLAITPTLTDEIEKELNDIAQEMGVDADVLIGELGLVKRDETLLQEHLKELGIPPEIYQKASGLDKALIETDYRKLYTGFIIFPEEGGMYTPVGHFLNHSGFAEGYREWEQGEEGYNTKGYYVLIERGDPPELTMPSAAQFMSPYLLTGNPELINTNHNNLCGQLAVIAALGLGIGEGIELFAYIDDYTFNIIKDPEEGTYASDLEKFINAVGDDRFDTAYTKKGDDAINTPEEFKKNLESGNKVICLVNINGNDNGKLAGVGSSRDISHWISVQDVITTKDNKTLVRVYNPYMNREEVYDWDTFSSAYAITTESSVANISVVAPSNNP
ncbi:MAG: LysM domain-containing protein [Anaerolineales bacterium]|jgi:hypothetical protein